MGTSRVLKIDPRQYPRLGTMQYRETLPLEDKEVVLTFDDGPMPPYTNRVLETLAQECVKANFFIVGRMARGYPELLRRIHDEGHVLGTHSENHPLAFEKMPLRAVQSEIDQGFVSTRNALGSAEAVAPFFRIPGLLRADTVESYLRSRGMVTWSADVVGDDWKHITANEVVTRTLARLDSRGKGIVLLHDIQPATALALPHLLRELYRRGYKIVQVAPATAPTTPALVANAAPAAVPAATTTATPLQKPAPQPQRETSTWPTPYPANTPGPTAARPAAVVAAPITPSVVTTSGAVSESRAVPDPAPAPVDITPSAAAANASPVPNAPPPRPTAPEPTRNPLQNPIMEFVRTVPASPHALPPEPPADAQQVSRPLTPGFKPSHSDSPSAKVSELPIERQQADPWAMRAEQQPPLKQPWPVTASSLIPPNRP